MQLITDDWCCVFLEGGVLMESLQRYIVSVCGAAIVVSVIQVLLPKDNGLFRIVKIVCGLFLTVTMLSPMLRDRVLDMSILKGNWSDSADQFIDSGTKMAMDQKNAIIKQRTQAYILEKAESMGLSISTEVTLDPESNQPGCVVLTGNLTPYEKSVLSQYIQQNLAIPKERQQWN